MITDYEEYLKENHYFQLTSKSPYFHRSYMGLTPFAANNKVSAYAQDQWDHHYHKGPGDQQRKMQKILNLMKQSGALDHVLDYKTELEQVKDLFVQRCQWDAGNMRLDVYLRFRVGELGEYWGVFRSFNEPDNRKLESEIFRQKELQVSREFWLQLKGLFERSLTQWFKPEEGHYQCLKPIIIKDWTGKPIRLKKNARIALKRVENWWNHKNPVIYLEQDDEEYTCSTPDYWFWNYRMDKTD